MDEGHVTNDEFSARSVETGAALQNLQHDLVKIRAFRARVRTEKAKKVRAVIKKLSKCAGQRHESGPNVI